MLWQNNNLPAASPSTDPALLPDHKYTGQLIAKPTPDLPLLTFYASFHSTLCVSLPVMLQAPSGLSIGLINASIVQNAFLSGYLVINDT